MPVLVRKIDRGKWVLPDSSRTEDIPADAITCCLRTKGNALSVWEARSEDSADLDDAILAMASAFDHLDTIDVVLADISHLREGGVTILCTPGRTNVEDLAHTHRDLACLSYGTLGVVAGHICEGIRQNQVRRVRKSELVDLLKNAICANRLDPDALDPNVRKKLGSISSGQKGRPSLPHAPP